MTTVDWTNTDIPRDRWGRPLILPPNARKNAKRTPYRRTTTFVGVLDDMNGLMKWQARQVALGMGQRNDLVLAAAAAKPDDKKTLGDIAEKAKEAAKSSAAADIGTALHSFTERIDRGEPIGAVPAEFRADLEAYKAATAHIKWLGIETFRVHDELEIAGTADRIGVLHGRTMIMDIKTGSIDYPHKMALQLACYARMTPYDAATDTRHADPQPVDLNYGVIIHLPAGQGRCDLYEIDIMKGWGAVNIARNVWQWRATKGLTRLIDGPPTAPPTWESLTLAATTVDELRTIWKRANECGDLTNDLNQLIKQRAAALEAAA
jgi:hypothetical protein